jgi:hypothetical protein
MKKMPSLISIAQASALCGMSPQLFAKRVRRGDVKLVRRLPKKLVRLDDVLQYARTVKPVAPKFRKPTAISKLFADPLWFAQMRRGSR